MTDFHLSLPLLETAAPAEATGAAGAWHGFSLAQPLGAEQPPEPEAPQGDYGSLQAAESPLLPGAGAAREYATGGPQPGRRGSATATRLHAGGAGARTDFRGSARRDRLHGHRNRGLHSRGALLLLQRPVPLLVADARPQRQPR